jgi:putative ABC transport system ATP-binding protein
VPEGLVVADDLDKRFGKTRALRGCSMSIGPGEIVAVMGPSGSGKSTLLHCMAGILRPDEGEVWFDGRRIDELSEGVRSAIRRDNFGFVFQFGQLVPDLTVLENVALPLRLRGVRRRDAMDMAGKQLRTVDLDGSAVARPSDLSGGEAQRVAVARAMVGEPRVIFADEPTGALDSLNSERIMELLVGIARDRGSAVVLVTHEPRVAAYADREIVVRDGRTVAAPVPA